MKTKKELTLLERDPVDLLEKLNRSNLGFYRELEKVQTVIVSAVDADLLTSSSHAACTSQLRTSILVAQQDPRFVRLPVVHRLGGRVLRQVVLVGTALIAAAASAFGQARCHAVGPHRIHTCVYAGEGPTLVLAAGAGQDSRTWSPLLEPLRALGTVVTFDRPGLGLTPDVDGPRTPTLIAQELRGALSLLGVSGPVVLIGHSMGGVHALRYADLFPEDVAAVVLLDTPPRSRRGDHAPLP